MRFQTNPQSVLRALPFLALFCLPEGVQAGEVTQIQGHRVRIRASDLADSLSSAVLRDVRVGMFVSESFLVGRVLEVDEGRMVIWAEGMSSSRTVRVNGVTQLDVWSRGTRKTAGAFLGVLAGGIIGGVIGNSYEKEPDPDPEGSDTYCSFICGGNWNMDLDLTPPPTVQGVFLGAAIGGVMGAFIGSKIPRDSWEPVEIAQSGIRVAAVVGSHPGFACSVSF